MLRNLLLIGLALMGAMLLASCAGSGATTVQADCQVLSGSYADAGEPKNDSFMQFLLKKKMPHARLVQLDVSADSLRASSGGTTHTLAAGKDFTCSGVGRIVLARQESSHVLLPPLIDQAKTVTYVLTGGARADLVLTTYVQTIIAPYGAKIKGPLQVQSITTWPRSGS